MKSVEPLYLELGHRIQARRRAKGMTQEQLGGHLQPRVGRASIANIETGKQRVLVHTLLQLARALDVDVSVLIPRAARERDFSVVEQELAEKLDLSRSDVKRLAARLETAQRGRTK